MFVDESKVSEFINSELSAAQGEQPTETNQAMAETRPVSQAGTTDTGNTGKRFTFDDLPDEIYDGDNKLTKDELKAQRMMQSDYTRKTQELAKARKDTEAHMEVIKALQNDPLAVADAIYKQLGVNRNSRGYEEPQQHSEDTNPISKEVQELREELRALKAERQSASEKSAFQQLIDKKAQKYPIFNEQPMQATLAAFIKANPDADPDVLADTLGASIDKTLRTYANAGKTPESKPSLSTMKGGAAPGTKPVTPHKKFGKELQEDVMKFLDSAIANGQTE